MSATKYSPRDLIAARNFVDRQVDDIVLRLQKTLKNISDPTASYKGNLVIPEPDLQDAIQGLITQMEVLDPMIKSSGIKSLDMAGYTNPEPHKGAMWSGIPFIDARQYPASFQFCYFSLRTAALNALRLQQYVPETVDGALNEFVEDVKAVAKLLSQKFNLSLF